MNGVVQGVIPGDQGPLPTIPTAKDTVQIFSTTFGLSAPTGAGGVPIGRINASPVALIKRFDRASPKLLRAALTHENLTIEITWFMTFQGLTQKTVTIRLDDAVITDIQAAADLHGTTVSDAETVTVTYSRLTFSTPIIDPTTHRVTGFTSVCIDAANNTTC